MCWEWLFEVFLCSWWQSVPQVRLPQTLQMPSPTSNLFIHKPAKKQTTFGELQIHDGLYGLNAALEGTNQNISSDLFPCQGWMWHCDIVAELDPRPCNYIWQARRKGERKQQIHFCPFSLSQNPPNHPTIPCPLCPCRYEPFLKLLGWILPSDSYLASTFCAGVKANQSIKAAADPRK